jgi:hypothetical protein
MLNLSRLLPPCMCPVRVEGGFLILKNPMGVSMNTLDSARALGKKVAKQQVHGAFFRVENTDMKDKQLSSERTQTIWGESVAEVKEYLNKSRQPFTNVTPLH